MKREEIELYLVSAFPRFKNVAELTNDFDGRGLTRLLDVSTLLLMKLEGVIAENGGDCRIGSSVCNVRLQDAKIFKVWIESQCMLTARAIKYNDTHFMATTIEGDSFDFKLELN